MSARAINWAHAALQHIDVPPVERLTLMCLAFHHHPTTGECYPSMETLGRECGVSSRRIQEAIANLVQWGVIKKQRGGTAAGNSSNRYTLFGHPQHPPQTGRPVPVSEGVKPEQKYRFETGNRLPVSNRKPCSDDRGKGIHGGEQAFSSVGKTAGGRA
ncbi:helix-turn-helix domain-containing protein [Cereibacter sphaeroides]|uniref:helix-turn-helix domain-containing protein n=1 Tax=Cereibacter sphaeroides TaxID=1063 RepID=UPI00313E9445